MQDPSLADNRKKWIEYLFCIILLFTLLFFSSSPTETVKRSLTLCYTTVIPAVFPFMIVTNLLLRTGAHRLLGSLLSRPMKLIFGCSESVSSAVALGFLCGFPVGAVSAATLYSNGEISKNELKRSLLFINNPSAAFVIGGVGIGMFSSAKIGRTLYLSVLIPAIMIGIISRYIFPADSISEHFTIEQRNDKKESFAFKLTQAISESAANMLTVCACVVFFSVPVGIISEIFGKYSTHADLGAILSSFFEISGGCRASGSLSSPLQALMMCAFACAWSGLSVHIQIFSVCGKCDVSFTPYIISKLIQGILSPLTVFLLTRKTTELTFANSTEISTSPIAQIFFLLLFITSVVVMGIWHSYNRVANCRTRSYN